MTPEAIAALQARAARSKAGQYRQGGSSSGFCAPAPSESKGGIDWEKLQRDDPKAYEAKRAEFVAARNKL